MTTERTLTLNLVKRASEVGGVQFHQLSGDDFPPGPSQGRSAEHENLVAAFADLRCLEKTLQEQAQALFDKHGLAGHGFAASLHFQYAPQWDKHRG